MGTADLHGSTIAIETGKGEKTTFELVRLGTLKEFETVKAARLTVTRKCEDQHADIVSLRDQVAKALERAEAADEAYVAEKKTSADLNNKLNADRARLTQLQEDYDDLKGRFNELAKDHVARGAELDSARNGHEAAKAARQAALDANASLTSELENLMSAKSSLEETNTALEVSQKELCEAREEHADAHVVLTAALGTAREERDETKARLNGAERERNASKQAFADLKAELLKHAGCMSDVLDAMHEKLAGE